MTVDDWCQDVFSYCKPVAKTAVDRVALVRAVAEGSGQFFFGSDSAPHPIQANKGNGYTTAGYSLFLLFFFFLLSTFFT